MARDVDQSEGEGTNQPQDDDHDEDFILLIGRYCIPFDKKNTFSQTLLLPFFSMLHLIVATNIDLEAHKATFNWTRAQFLIQVAHGVPIDLPLWIFEKICYKTSIISIDNLPYGVIIIWLLLEWRVSPQAEE